MTPPLDSRPPATVLSSSVLCDQVVEILVRGVEGRFPFCQVTVFRIGRYEDAWVFSGGMAAGEDQSRVSLRREDSWPPGLYRVTDMAFIPSETGTATDPDVVHANVSGEMFFEVRLPDAQPRRAEELAAEYARVLAERQAEFMAGIGPEDAPEHAVFVFIKDCHVTVPMRLGPYEIGPAGSLEFETERTMVSTFFKRWTKSEEFAELPVPPLGLLRRPCAVAHFPCIRAAGHEEAGKLAVVNAQFVSDVLGVSRMSYGTVLAVAVVDRGTGTLAIDWREPTYRGNHAGGFISGEEPESLRAALMRVGRDPRQRFLVSLLRETLRQEGWEAVSFACWSLLETVARSKEYIGQVRRDWSGTALKGKHGQALRIENHAKELVFELLRQHHGPGDLPLLDATMKQHSPSELLDIWYQRRNCIGHTGACQPFDPQICRKEQATCVRCNLAREETIEMGRDEYVSALRYLVIEVVRKECGYYAPA